MQFRIGERDPMSGLYDVIAPDGSSTRNGIKIFNSAHKTGDVVQAIRRSDGMIILDSAKGFDTLQSIGIVDLFEPPKGYLHGQVFNAEEPAKTRRRAFLALQDTLLDIVLGNVTLEEASALPANLVVQQNQRGPLGFNVIYYSVGEAVSPDIRPNMTLALSANVLPAFPVQPLGNEYLWAIGNQVDRLGFVAPFESPTTLDPVSILTGTISTPSNAYPEFLFLAISVEAERFPELSSFIGTMTIQVIEFEGFSLGNNFAEITYL